jgi:hypothetical protein
LPLTVCTPGLVPGACVPLTVVAGRVPVPDSFAPEDTVTLLLVVILLFTRSSPVVIEVEPV